MVQHKLRIEAFNPPPVAVGSVFGVAVLEEDMEKNHLTPFKKRRRVEETAGK